MNYELEAKKALVQLAKIFNRPIDSDVVNFYWCALQTYQVAPESIYRAILDLGVASRFFPTPNDILERINPSVNTDEEAKVLAAEVMACVSAYGWNNPDKAQHRIGEFGWDVIVKQMGGWREFCRVAGEAENAPAQYAQFRELLKAKMNKLKRGQNQPITEAALLADNVLKMIPNMNLKQIPKE